ncbi:putative aminotransferase [Corynebacterium efficiens YS-314]|uniref:Putative aminotransferase n=2 Tax=Corynebacterium efficiens TaxID=152794 RepID=Q8FNK8_COREF|nr:putative aminotransferase [Corynebacterium efficiens YS-314]
MPESTMNRVTTSHDDPLCDPLRYHGDRAADGAVLDFAVNVQADAPPDWLREVVRSGVDTLGSYPGHELYRDATAAVAAHHGVTPEQVLLLNGAAEGFSLLARLRPAWPVIIHPGFTEPEACLVDAGIDVDRVVLRAPFDLDRAIDALGFGEVHEEADLVVIGNPTNPTGRLYGVDELSRLAEPWRYLVIDEAFLDVADHTHATSMISRIGQIPGLIVLRSLTKTWSLAGLRCGYLISDAETVTRLSRGRAHWPLGTLQLRAIQAVMEQGTPHLPTITADIARNRESMVTALETAGFTVHPSAAPYLLVQPPGGADRAERTRRALADRGIAVRRCDTFPGLDSGFWRLAVREPAQVAALLQAIADIGA